MYNIPVNISHSCGFMNHRDSVLHLNNPALLTVYSKQLFTSQNDKKDASSDDDDDDD